MSRGVEVRCREDLLWLAPWLRDIVLLHFWSGQGIWTGLNIHPIRIETHVVFNGLSGLRGEGRRRLECDLVLTGMVGGKLKPPPGVDEETMIKIMFGEISPEQAGVRPGEFRVVGARKRRVLVELKETDLAKAIEQAITRRPNFDYVYVAADLCTADLLSWLRSRPEPLRYGVGFVSVKDQCIVIRSYGRRYWGESCKYGELLSYMGGED